MRTTGHKLNNKPPTIPEDTIFVLNHKRAQHIYENSDDVNKRERGKKKRRLDSNWNDATHNKKVNI